MMIQVKKGEVEGTLILGRVKSDFRAAFKPAKIKGMCATKENLADTKVL